MFFPRVRTGNTDPTDPSVFDILLVFTGKATSAPSPHLVRGEFAAIVIEKIYAGNHLALICEYAFKVLKGLYTLLAFASF